jgi:hypothetical protein
MAPLTGVVTPLFYFRLGRRHVDGFLAARNLLSRWQCGQSQHPGRHQPNEGGREVHGSCLSLSVPKRFLHLGDGRFLRIAALQTPEAQKVDRPVKSDSSKEHENDNDDQDDANDTDAAMTEAEAATEAAQQEDD